MPLLRRTPFERAEPPANAAPGTPVFKVRFTGEEFVRYEDFAARMDLYRQRAWTCALTGRVRLTFEEALLSEEEAAEDIEDYPEWCFEPLLRTVQYSTAGRLEDLVNEIYDTLNERFFVGEDVVVEKAEGEHNLIGEVTEIHVGKNTGAATAPQGAQADGGGAEKDAQMANGEGKSSPASKRRTRVVARKDGADLYSVKWAELAEGETPNETDGATVPASRMTRPRGVINKEMMAMAVRLYAVQPVKPVTWWRLKDDVAAKHGISTTVPASLRGTVDKALAEKAKLEVAARAKKEKQAAEKAKKRAREEKKEADAAAKRAKAEAAAKGLDPSRAKSGSVAATPTKPAKGGAPGASGGVAKKAPVPKKSPKHKAPKKVWPNMEKLTRQQVIAEIEALGAKPSSDTAHVIKLKKQLATVREREERRLQKEFEKELRKEQREKEQAIKRAEREAKLAAERKAREERKAAEAAAREAAKRYPIDEALLEEERAAEREVALARGEVPPKEAPWPRPVPDARGEVLPTSMALCDFLEFFSEGCSALPGTPELAELLEALEAPASSPIVPQLYEGVLAMLLGDNEFWGMDGVVEAPPRWKRVLNRHTWPELARRFVLAGPTSKVHRAAADAHGAAAARASAESLGSKAWHALGAEKHVALLQGLFDDCVGTASLRSGIQSRLDEQAKLQSEKWAAARERAKEERERKAEERERKAAEKAKEGEAAAEDGEGANGSDGEGAGKEEDVRPPDELPEEVRIFRGDPCDRKALLAHRKKVSDMDAELTKRRIEWDRRHRETAMREAAESKREAKERQQAEEEAEERAAEAARQRALAIANKHRDADELEKRLQQLATRSEPLGMDRKGNRYWWLKVDRSCVYVEGADGKWSRYTYMAEIDALLDYLDYRGVQERPLIERLKGVHGRLKMYLRKAEYDAGAAGASSAGAAPSSQATPARRRLGGATAGARNAAAERDASATRAISLVLAGILEAADAKASVLSVVRGAQTVQELRDATLAAEEVVFEAELEEHGEDEDMSEADEEDAANGSGDVAATEGEGEDEGDDDDESEDELEYEEEADVEVRAWWRALHNGDDDEQRKRCRMDAGGRSAGGRTRSRGSKKVSRVPRVWEFDVDREQWRADVTGASTLSAVAYHAWVLSDRAAPLLESISRSSYQHRLRADAASTPKKAGKGKKGGRKGARYDSGSEDEGGEDKFDHEKGVPERFQLVLTGDEDATAAHYLIRDFRLRDAAGKPRGPDIFETAPGSKLTIDGELVIPAGKKQTPHHRPGADGVMNVSLGVVDWALDYGDEETPPVLWLQTANGAYLKLLECAESFEEHMVGANAMLHLTARTILRLEWHPSSTMREASCLDELLRPKHEQPHFALGDLRGIAWFIWEQLQGHFTPEHEFGMVPLSCRLAVDLQAFARGESVPLVEAVEERLKKPAGYAKEEDTSAADGEARAMEK